MESLIRESERAGFWTLQAGIFPENQASLELHQQCGFRVVGRREKIGRMTFGPQAGEWRDVLLLERRSELEGGTNL
jgi:phosphinothricin acetyltransferase